jgi:hypothetical protein
MSVVCEWIDWLIAVEIWGLSNEGYGVHTVHIVRTMHTIHTVHTVQTANTVYTVQIVRTVRTVHIVHFHHTVHILHTQYTLHTTHSLHLVQFCNQFINNLHLFASHTLMCLFPCCPLCHSAVYCIILC